MKNKDTFGCTTFRKGNYLGRSYDFYCNDVASSILHTSGIEGVRYESIGMSGSSFNGMKKDKALDGTIDKATMDKLFSSIVDGINEKGVAISALVVPRGDKGVTTGTNKGKDTIPAKMVPRVVLDKAYSAKNAIELLSTRNIVQNFGTDYELHWMIADGTDTYLVETVNNKLSYLGPRAIEGIEDLYSGTLEADVVTNFYQTGFDSTQGEHTFEMPITNPTVTPYGAGLERYKIVRAKLESVNGSFADDKEAMGVINLVPYTRTYADDTEWYTEFVDHAKGVNNRASLTEEKIQATGKLPEVTLIYNDQYYYYEIEPPTDPNFFAVDNGYPRFNCGCPSLMSDPYRYYGLQAYQGAYWNQLRGISLEEDKWYIENSFFNPNQPDIMELPLDKDDVSYRDPKDTGLWGDLISCRVTADSDYVEHAKKMKAAYQSVLENGGKDAVRALGLSWHSNHQCIYDLANKTMLVYPSENGDHAFRVDIHGAVEDEAVEAGIDILPLGGRIFYIDSNDNGAIYHFYRKDGSEIEGWTDVASLSDAVSYSVEGEPTADKVYVLDNSKNALATSKRWTYRDGKDFKYEQIFTTPSDTYEIGQGRINTQTVMTKDDGKYITDNSNGYATIWQVCDEVNKSERGGWSDWFIPSQKELDALRTSSVAPAAWFSNNIWTSSEASNRTARSQGSGGSGFYSSRKDSIYCCVCVRAF